MQLIFAVMLPAEEKFWVLFNREFNTPFYGENERSNDYEYNFNGDSIICSCGTAVYCGGVCRRSRQCIQLEQYTVATVARNRSKESFLCSC